MNNVIENINFIVSKKKIVLVEGDIMNGITGFRKDLVNALELKGYQISILGSYEDGRVPINDSRLIDIGSTALLNTIHYNILLLKALLHVKPDLCLTYNMRPTIYTNLITYLLSIPTISNITGIGPLFESNNISYKIARVLYKMTLKNPIKVFFQNTADTSIFLKKRFVNESQVIIVPGSGVKTDFFTPIEKQKQSNFIFLMVARLLKDKGVYEFIEAARIIKNKYLDVDFQLLGRFWIEKGSAEYVTENQVKEWVNEGLIKHFEITNNIRPFYINADCIVLPSYREGTANVLLEAGSMEKPLITTNVPGCQEIVDNGVNGFICKVKSSVDLANTMEKMLSLNDIERNQMGKASREKMIKEFDKSIVIDSYLETIKSII